MSVFVCVCVCIWYIIIIIIIITHRTNKNNNIIIIVSCYACAVGRRHRRTKMTRGQRSVIFFRRRLRLAVR